MSEMFDKLSGLKGTSEIKTTGEAEVKTVPVIGYPGNYELYLTDLADVRVSQSGKVQIKFAMETEKVEDTNFKPVQSSKRGGQVCSAQLGIYFNPSDSLNKQTQEFYRNLGIICKQAGVLEEFNKLDRNNFQSFLKDTIDLLDGKKLAYQLNGEEWFKEDKNDPNIVRKQYSLSFGRYNFVKPTLEELPEFDKEKAIRKFDYENSGSETQKNLYKRFSEANGTSLSTEPVETEEEETPF